MLNTYYFKGSQCGSIVKMRFNVNYYGQCQARCVFMLILPAVGSSFIITEQNRQQYQGSHLIFGKESK